MTIHVSNNVLSGLHKAIRELMNDRADHVSGGGCKDYSEYSHSCGVIEGLAMAERELLDLNERMERE